MMLPNMKMGLWMMNELTEENKNIQVLQVVFVNDNHIVMSQ